MMKRVFSFFLCLCMVFSLIPVNAFAAADPEDPSETPTVTEEQEQTPSQPAGDSAEQPSEASDEPTEESQTPSDPTGESQEATDPTEESQEATDPTKESQEATDPTEESQAATDPTEESQAATDPTEESQAATDPTEESQAATDPTEESQEVTDPTEESEDEDTSDEPEEESFVCAGQTIIPDVDLPENDDLFAMYAEQQFYGSYFSFFGMSAGSRLEGDEALIYNALASYIQAIASGERTSTVITLGRTLTNIPVSGSDETMDFISDEAFTFSIASFGQDALVRVLHALLQDFPYEMYWFDKTVGCQVFPVSNGKVLVTMAFYFSVAENYSAGTYTTNAALTSAAATSAANAQKIIDKYASASDYEKLTGYRDEICDLVSYDSAAAKAGNFSEDDDPWQLIHVFDGDSTTNVVCEGYSKAFQYLCDLTTFSGDVICYRVTGDLVAAGGGGAHMWNIVTIGGKQYLVDVTNSETGTVGANGSLFLAGTEANDDGSYTFGRVTFVYDSSTTNLWGTDEDSILLLAGENYSEAGNEEGGEETNPAYTQADFEEDLAAATEAGTTLELTQSVTLTSDLEIGANAALKIAAGGSLTVSGGVTLTVKGSLENNGVFTAADGSTLVIYGSFTAGSEASTTTGSATVCCMASDAEENGLLLGTVDAVSVEKQILSYCGSLEANLRKAIELVATEGYASGILTLNGDIRLSDDLTIPENIHLVIGLDAASAALTVPGGLILTNNGSVAISTNGTLTLETGALLLGTGSLTNSGTYTNSSLVEDDQSILQYVSSDDTLLAAVENGLSTTEKEYIIRIQGDLTLASDAALSERMTLEIPALSSLTITGALTNYGCVSVSGTLSCTGTYTELDDGRLCAAPGATVSGIDMDSVTASYSVQTEEALRAALAVTGYGKIAVDIPGAEITLTDDLLIPENAVLNIGRASENASLTIASGITLTNSGTINVLSCGSLILQSGGSLKGNAPVYRQADLNDMEQLRVALALGNALQIGETVVITENITIPSGFTLEILHNGKLEVAKGATLTVKGGLRLSGGALLVRSGGTLRNSGEIVTASGQAGSETRFSTLTIASGGTYVHGTGAALYNSWDTGYDCPTGTISGIDEDLIKVTCSVSSQEELISAVSGGVNQVVVSGSFTLTEGLTIPSDVSVMIASRVTLTVDTTGSLTNNGSIQVYGTLAVNAATLAGNPITCMASGTVTGSAVKPYDYYTRGKKVSEISISEDVTVPLGTSVKLSVLEYAPTDADFTYTFTVLSGEDAWVDEDNVLHSDAPGSVTVGVSCYDSEGTLINGVSDTMTVTFVDQSILVSFSDEYPIDKNTGYPTIYGGDSIPFTAEICAFDADELVQSSNLTGTGIVWSLASGNEAYASVSVENGVATVTAKNVTKRQTVTLTARAKDGSAGDSSVSILILPRARKVTLEMTDVFGTTSDVTGKTVSFDLNRTYTAEAGANPVPQRTVSLTAAVAPADADDAAVWASSDTAIATVSGGVVTFTGETGTVTITATISDGSGKRASVTFRTVELVQSIRPSSTTKTSLIGGNSASYRVKDADGWLVSTSAVKWFLCDAKGNALRSHPYASITAAGKLTTKAVSRPTTVYLMAQVIGDEKAATLKTPVAVTLCPAVVKVELTDGDGTILNGTTLRLDSKKNGKVYSDLKLNVYPSAKSVKSIILSSSKKSVATVDNDGDITFHAPGTATITATVTALDGTKTTASFKVRYGLFVKSFKNVTVPSTLRSGKYRTLKASVTPSNATTTGVTWSLPNSADKEYASLSTKNGVTKLKAKTVTNPRTITLRLSSKDGWTYKDYEVTILPKSSKAVYIVLADSDADDYTYVTGTTQRVKPGAKLKLALVDKNGEVEDVTWKSSSKKYAKVGKTSGTVTGVKAGTATITATTSDGRTAKVTIKVGKVAKSVAITTSASQVTSGGSLTLKTKVTYSNGSTSTSSGAVTWIVSDPDVAEISSKGKLTAVSGLMKSTKITVQAVSSDGKAVSKAKTITVKPAARSIEIFGENGAVLNNTTLYWNMSADKSISLDHDVYPRNSSNSSYNASKLVTWSSSKPSVAKINASSGAITCVADGTTTITATSKDGTGTKASFTLTVVKLALPKTASIAGGKALDMTALSGYTISSTTGKQLVWTLRSAGETADLAYATLSSSGVLSTAAVTDDKVVIVQAATRDGSFSASCTVTIHPAATKIQILKENGSKASGTLYVGLGETMDLGALIYPKGSTLDASALQNVRWSSSNSSYATVKSTTGVVTGKTVGKTVTITATARDGSGVTASVKVKVIRPVQSLSLANQHIAGGATRDLAARAKFTPSNATIQDLKWEITGGNGAEYVTLSSAGVLTTSAVQKPKQVTIRATTKDSTNLSADFTVTIYPATTQVQILSGSKVLSSSTTIPLAEGDTLDLDAKNAPYDAYQGWIWSSSDKSYATVSTKGVVTAVKGGKTVTITATAADGSGRKATIQVKTIQLVEKITVSNSRMYIGSGKSLTLNPTVSPSDATYTALTWELVWGSKYASISTDGVLTAKSTVTDPVDVTVRVYAKNGGYQKTATKTYTVTIYPITTSMKIVRSGTASINGTTLNLLTGKNLNVQAEFTPDNSAGCFETNACTWTSSNTSVAKIRANNDGTVTIVSQGKTGSAKITATSRDGSGKTASFTIKYSS